MAVDVVGDGGRSRPREILSFAHWWNDVQQQCAPHRWMGRELAKIAWNAALERAARECGGMQLAAAAVDYAAVCRQFQVPTPEEQP